MNGPTAFRLTAFALAIGVTSSPGRSQASTEWLFGVRINTGCCKLLERLRPSDASPELVWSWVGGSISADELTWSGERLLSYSTATNPDRIVAYHPANGVVTVIGSTGMNNNTIGRGIERDPTTGLTYVITQLLLYTANPNTASLTLVGQFSGFKANWDSAVVMAIDQNGVAFVLGKNDGNGRHAYYGLDLATAQLTWIADLVVPSGQGTFLAAAVSSTGEVWTSYQGSPLSPNAQGVYKIDPNSFGVTLVRYMPEPYYGLAFVPTNTQATYCAAKASSNGCLPAIFADGFPSPTANSGYTIRSSQVRNQTSGTLAFSLGGRATLPFGGGTLCLTPPMRRTGMRSSGGSPAGFVDCSGAWELDFNTWLAQNLTLPPGTTVRAQWLGRDPGFPAPNNWSLSDALEFDLRP